MAPDPALFLLGTLERGGSETKFVRLAGRLHEAGLPVDLAWLGGSDALLDELHPGVPRHALRRERSLSPAALLRLRRVLSDRRAGSVVCVNFFPMIYGWAARQTIRLPRLVASINTTDLRGTRESRFMTLYAPLLRRMDQVVFGSSRQQDQWTKAFRVAPENCRVVYNGVDSARYRPASSSERASHRQRLGFAPDTIVFVSVAQLRPEKGHEHLIEAFASPSLPGNRALVLVGDGVRRSALEEQARAAGLESRVVFAGEQADVGPWLQAADAFVLASTAVETFSNAALEAAACGLALVMTDIGGARELVGPDGQDWLVPPGDVAAMEAALLGLATDPVKLGEAGEMARKRVLEHFSTRQMDDAWRELLWPDARPSAGIAA
jgi:glycosyltransferase involved in cell wall biosynthesis